MPAVAPTLLLKRFKQARTFSEPVHTSEALSEPQTGLWVRFRSTCEPWTGLWVRFREVQVQTSVRDWTTASLFKRFKVYSRSLLNTELAGIVVKVVVKVLNILSLATKEVEQSRTSESFLYSRWTCSTTLINYLERYIKRLAGKKDIENAVGELENLIQGEHYTVTAQVLQDTTELRRGAYPCRSGTIYRLNLSA